ALGGAQGAGEQVGTLAVVPGPVVTADGVVVGDRAAVSQHRLGGGGLDVAPLLELRPATAGREHGEVGRRAVGIDVGEAAGREAAAAYVLQRPLDRNGDAGVEGGEPVPGDGGLEGLGDARQRDHRVAAV